MHAVSVTMETSASSGTEFVSMPLLLIKDEAHDDPEMADTNFTQQSHYMEPEPDPMNLLDPMYDSQQEISVDSDSEQQQIHSGLTPEIWQDWMAEYPWLLHEETDDNEGYCLYCNITVSYKPTKTPRNHAISRNHREYEENYLAFKESEDQANMSVVANAVTVKQEFGTDSDISAIKYKRMSQTEPLFNFIWRRWQKRHTWLERDKDDMTHGYCKYCKQRICVEYSYMRMRHEVGIKHRIATKRAKKSNRKRSSDSGKGQNQDTKDKENESEVYEEFEMDKQNDEERSNNGKSNDELSKENEEEESDQIRISKRKRKRRGSLNMNPWLELHNTTPQTCRCKLCNVKMHASNFQRHLHTRVHQEREKNLKTRNMAPNIKQEISIRSKNWKTYAKKHRWLIEDPEDGNFGYCKYCKKRLLYAIHPLKRLMHERGESHKRAVKRFFKNLRRENGKNNSNNENDEEEHEEVEEHEQNTEEEQIDADENYQDTEADANNEEDVEKADYEENEHDDDDDDEDMDIEENQAEKSRTRHPFGSDGWFALYPWSKRYKDDPNYMYCSYCKTKLKLTFRRKQHERSTRHQEASKAVKKLQGLSNWERSRQDKRITYYPWLVYTKNPQFVFCKYCRVRIHKSHSRTKHEITRRHRESKAAFDSKKELPSTANTSSNSLKESNSIKTTSSRYKALVSTQQPRAVAKVALWRNRFPWLTHRRNELQPNYGYCKYCEMRVFVLTEKYALKHQKSLKHIRIRMQLKRQELKTQVEQVRDHIEQKSAAATDKTSAGHLDNEQNKEYQWLLPDTQNDPHYGFCKYCNVRINITGILKDRHQQTIKHTKAELEIANKKMQKSNREESKDSDSDEVIVLDDNNMNDNSVKLERMSEDDVLEYLLQRSDQSKISKDLRNADALQNMEMHSNRQQTSSNRDNLIDRAQRLTSAHLEILRLTRDFNDSKTAKQSGRMSLPTSIFHTSAAVAAILSPPQAPPTPITPTTPATPVARNNFELFFDSVCESVKTLPSDLAAEGKIKIAQLVADLEMRALQRSQCQDLHNTSLRQNIATPMSSHTSNDNASPLSNVDVPSTTTNGFEKEHLASTTNTESTQPKQSIPKHSLDNKLRIVPISSLIDQSKTTTDPTNAFRMREGTPQITSTQIKRIQMNPAFQQSITNKKTDISVARVTHHPQNSGSHTTPQRSQNQLNPSLASMTQYQPSQQIVSSSPDSVGSSPRSHMPTNATVIDNGIRRIHLLNSRPIQASQQATSGLGFRQIHLPLKGTTITKTNAASHMINTSANCKPSSSSSYINHTPNA